MPKLTLTGTVIQADPETRISGLLTVTKLGSHALGTERDASATAITVDAPDDSIVKIEYENGLTEWLRADQFASEIGQNRDATGAVIVPRVIDRGETTRGPVGWVLKTLHLFGVSPTDVLARESAAEIVQHFDAKLNLGLFRLSKEGNFQSQITTSDQLDNQKPYLVFIHGTASSTAGSFSGFWSGDNNQPTAEWTQMLAKYPDRILALEHATFSVSPAQNALDLVNLLPHGAAVHLISHSRGGLVGELLGLDPSQIADLGAFKGRNDEKLIGDLLNGLRDKKITVQKFVRVACPASGTILAAKRMDIYLNVLLNAIGLIPGINVSPAYDVFKATALELIKLRADPATIPGIEAMMPESPFIHFLNTKGRTSKADLGVIAGNYEGAGVWGTLKSYALRAYYWEDNDIVVNTRSMTGGTERTSGVWEYFEEGDTVNHFHYFKNLSTRGRVLQWLSSDAPPSGYEHVRGVVAPQSRGEGDQAGVVFVLPDVFASEIKDEQQSIWLNFDALAAGALLSLKNDNLKAGDLLTTYKGLVEKLASVYNVRPFGYDWRKSVKDSAALLAQEVRNQNKGPIHFIGHGMGGLVLLEFLASNQDDWQKLRANGSKIVLLGAPTRGSWQIAKLLRGHASLVKMLALLGRHSDAEIVELVQGFQGLLDLLPDSMLDSQAWQSSPFTRPDPVRLAATRDWREKLRGAVFPTERMVYVAGSAPSTPSALDQYTVSGDGHVTYEMGLM
ncbi:MAG TPA: alpha/beta fold hydrolase, partial [Terriglobales bacterium]|nr:alpha/beta fold hydrolase [Terriglobales bacterium]